MTSVTGIGFLRKSVAPCRERLDAERLGSKGSDGQDRDVPAPPQGMQRARHGESVHHREHQVEHDDVGSEARYLLEGFFSIRGLTDEEALALELERQEFARGLLVFGDEHPYRTRPAAGDRPALRDTLGVGHVCIVATFAVHAFAFLHAIGLKLRFGPSIRAG